VLGGGSVSRLYRALVADQKITASAAAWYGGSAVDESRFAVWAAPLPGVSFATVEAAVDAVIADLAENGIEEAELDRAKTRLVAESIYARDSQSSLARYFGSTLAVGGTVADLQAWPARIAAVTPEAVREAARRHLAEARSVVGLLEGAD